MNFTPLARYASQIKDRGPLMIKSNPYFYKPYPLPSPKRDSTEASQSMVPCCSLGVEAGRTSRSGEATTATSLQGSVDLLRGSVAHALAIVVASGREHPALFAAWQSCTPNLPTKIIPTKIC